MTHPTIRDSKLADIDAIQRIYGHHVLNGLASFEETVPTTEELARRRLDVLGRGMPYLVAEFQGSVVGYSYVAPYRARPAYRYAVENSVYIESGLIRRGIGQALLGALITHCEAGPWRQMVAVIGDSANQASLGLHARAGFRIVGTFEAVGFKFGRWVDSVLMQRALGDGAGRAPDH
jgi:phosphinothricin acetyltransferase